MSRDTFEQMQEYVKRARFEGLDSHLSMVTFFLTQNLTVHGICPGTTVTNRDVWDRLWSGKKVTAVGT